MKSAKEQIVNYKFKINEKVKTGRGIGIVTDTIYNPDYNFKEYLIKYEDGIKVWHLEKLIKKVEE